MGKINIGLVEEGNRSVMVVLTSVHGELYQQVVIDKTAEVAPRRRLQDAGAKPYQPTSVLFLAPGS